MSQELRQVIGIALFVVAMVLLWLALRPRKANPSSEHVDAPMPPRVHPPIKAKPQPSWVQDGSYERFQQAVSAAKVSPVSFLSDDDDIDDETESDVESDVDEEDQVSRPAENYASPPLPAIANAVLAPPTLRGFFVEVVGESFHASTFPELLKTHGREPFHVEMLAEPENKFDSHAVRIATIEGAPLGYLTREAAPRYQQSVLALRARQQRVLCHGRLVGGDSDRPNIGIWLDVEVPTAVARALGVKYKPVRK